MDEPSHGKDDRVFLIGVSPDDGNMDRIIQLSLNTMEEHILGEMPSTSPYGVVRLESTFIPLNSTL